MNDALKISELEKLSATNIMIDITPGWDGMGHEVYAKSVEDIEDLLTKMSTDLEYAQCELHKLQKQYTWVPLTKSLLESQVDWLYEPLWIAGDFGIDQAVYEWRQGRFPDCFDTTSGRDCYGLSEITHIMPITIPKLPSKK